MTKGYVYCVTRFNIDHQPDRTRVKIGFLTNLAIESEIHNQYCRSLTPLCILHVIPVGDARAAETIMHLALAKYRINKKHEIFNIDSKSGRQDFTKAVELVVQIDSMSGLPRPMDRPIDYARWLVSRDAATAGRRVMKRLENLEAAKRLKIEKEEQRVKELAEKARRVEEAERLQLEEKQRVIDEKADGLKRNRDDAIGKFFDGHIDDTNDDSDCVNRAQMFRSFERLFPEIQSHKCSRVDKKIFMEYLMDHFGFERHRLKYRRMSDVFVGARMKLS